MKKYFIGIDPGKKGGIVVLNKEGSPLLIAVTPFIGKTDYDKHEMISILAEYLDEAYVVLEDVHAIQGKVGGTSNFEFGRGKGLWEMALCALDFSHTLVQPKAWQKEMWEGIKKVTSPTKRALKGGGFVEKVETKDTSLVAAKRLFPNVKLTDPKSERATVPHDGIVDALLIAEYCRRKFKS